ncbi:unnamed protein product [Symbiodinium natans]|uniref:Fe2OG dioxygenase domain-containing protein n=1 Tax=Symbiodinium natans TaxID=878477 RepID=A0A812U913_9DINO|nr:unnamed protein product [Symbiodinium natans]
MAPAPTSPKPTHNVRMKPAEEEVQLVMQRLGIESDEARTALSKGLPKGWLACRADDGEAYYHQPSTGVTQWRHPGRDWTSADATKLATELVKSRGDDPKGDENLQETSPEHSVYDARSRHVELETPDSLFSATAGIVREDIVGRAFALRGLLTPEEAATYVKSAQKAGFGQSDVSREFPPSLRNNSRLIHFSDALALALYRRLVPHLAHRDVYLVQPMGFGAEGRWKPVGVNPCFRISQYKEREHFATHCDGMYANDNDECSIYSLVLYLNEDYEGGELEFTESGKRFRPTAGTAVLLPHDLSHAGQEVLKGTKYVARSELMFRCVDRRPPPAVPQYADDPLFQRMAALYEQIGDLAAKGDALATTEAYQEALGIQIAHQGTDVKQRDARPLPFEDKAVEYILSFLDPLEVGRILTVCRRWCSVSMAGALWQGFCRQRWPNESEVLEGAAYGLEPELKDWLGFYRKQHILSTKAPVSVIFFASALQIWAEKSEQTEVKAVPALFAHDLDGIGWDSSFKQRVGWEVGTHPWSRKRFWHGNAEALNDAGNQDNRKGYLQGRARHNKAFEMPGFGQVDFEVLSEAFDWAFRKLGIRPSDHHLVVPVLPSLFKQSSRSRLAQILSRRFQVPRLSMVDAPLCALRARELKTGAVIWGEQLSRSTIFFYLDGEELATSEVKDLARLLTQATELLGPLMAAALLQARVLADVVLSPQLSLQEPGIEGN